MSFHSIFEIDAGLRSVVMPFGATITDEDSSINFFGGPCPTNLTYASSNGLRVWTHDGEVREFPGDVVARMNKDYRLCVNGTEGAMIGVFNMISVIAITPASGSIKSMRISLMQTMPKHPVH